LESIRKDKTKIGSVGVIHEEWGRVNGGDKGEGIWLMGFIYIYEIEQ
jgi:hypothetical protein